MVIINHHKLKLTVSASDNHHRHLATGLVHAFIAVATGSILLKQQPAIYSSSRKSLVLVMLVSVLALVLVLPVQKQAQLVHGRQVARLLARYTCSQ